MFNRFDTRTDRRTDILRQHNPCYASRGKIDTKIMYFPSTGRPTSWGQYIVGPGVSQAGGGAVPRARDGCAYGIKACRMFYLYLCFICFYLRAAVSKRGSPPCCPVQKSITSLSFTCTNFWTNKINKDGHWDGTETAGMLNWKLMRGRKRNRCRRKQSSIDRR